MKLYQDSNGIWHYDTTTLVAGDLRLKDMGEEGIHLYWGNSKQPIFRGDVGELKREDGSPYEDVETLLTECKDFFVNPLNPLAEEVEGLKESKQDKLPIDEEYGDESKVLNEVGEFKQLAHADLVSSTLNSDSNHLHITQEEKDSFALHGYDETETIKTLKEVETKAETDLENAIFKTVNVGSGGLVALKPTSKALNYKLTLHENAILFIDISKMVEQVGSARCRFIIDMPIARTITFANPILWGGDVPNLSSAGQYVFEIVDVDGEIAMMWLVAKTTKKPYSGYTLYVDSDEADYSVGQINGETATRTTSSWANPFKYLQNAIIAAQEGDVIFVKEGTHYPTHKRTTNTYTDGDKIDRTATFTVKNGVDIYGGFKGDENYIWERETENGYMVNETILNGDLQRDEVKANFSYNVVYANVASYTYINGVKVVNGNADGSVVLETNGSGFYSNNNNHVKINCVIDNCSATDSGGGSYSGTLYNATFSNCSATNNGGGSHYGTLYNATFSNCSAANRGGGSYDGTLYNATFSNCSATKGGGGSYYGTLYNSVYSGCSALDGGGWRGGTKYNCIAFGCVATRYGGGAWFGTDRNCIFINNIAGTSGEGSGGGGYNYDATVNGCVFINNSGRGYNNIERNGTLINSLFVGNVDLDGTTKQAITGGTFITAYFRNNAYDTAHPTISGGVGSDIDLSTCIENLTTEQAGITVPSFVGLPATEAQRLELEEYVKNIRTHLKPLKTSILKDKGINNATYPNVSDFEGTERPENCTIGAFEAHEE